MVCPQCPTQLGLFIFCLARSDTHLHLRSLATSNARHFLFSVLNYRELGSGGRRERQGVSKVKQDLCDLINGKVSDPALPSLQHGQSVKDGTIDKVQAQQRVTVRMRE